MTVQDGSGSNGNGLAIALTPLPAANTGAQITAQPAGVVAFVGRCLKGPVNEPVAITDFSQFERHFGGLWSRSMLPHAVEQFFEHGGQRAIIVRVVSDALPPSIDLPAGDERLVLVALSPGSQEFLRVAVDYDGIDQQDQDLFNLVVQRVRRRGSELVQNQEIFRRVSVLGGSARDAARMLSASSLVRVSGPLPARRPDITRGSDPRELIGYVDCNNDGDDGRALSDYDLIGSESRRSGMFALLAGPAFSFIYLPPPARDQDLGMSVLVVGARFCRRQHALLLVDPPHHWKTVQQALDGLRDWPFHSADALMFYPRVITQDRLRACSDVFPPSAAAVGMLVRERGEQVWQEAAEPALLRPTASPVVWVDRLQRASLAQRGVNTLRATRMAARDVVAMCTLAGEFGNGPDARVLGARQLALFISASIERGTRWVTIEGNTARSRERVCRQVEQFLRQLAEAGALAGAERNLHYFVLCDQRLNGSLQMAEGVFRLVYGYQSVHGTTRLSWLVEHRAAASQTRAVSLNQLAAHELR
ncbi:MAG: hypothetical protein ABIQ86_08440 [Steroidobacteraceae bacterium]